MKTFTLTFTIDDSVSGGLESSYQLAVALKYTLDNRYGFEQVKDIQPVAEKPKPVRAFCLVRK